MKHLWLCPLVAALVAGCGGTGAKGTASVWITRDRGAHVLLVKKVPAGVTAMQALDRVAELKTRYGGRFVQSINGIEGSLAGQRDWFYFVNGYEADRSAAEYVLRPGDVEWWDFRSWKGGAKQVPVAVGAFPEPFLHGYNGKRRPTVVLGNDPVGGRALAKLLGARFARVDLSVYELQVRGGRNALFLRPGPTKFSASTTGAGRPVVFNFSGDWHDLLKGKFRYRYEVKP